MIKTLWDSFNNLIVLGEQIICKRVDVTEKAKVYIDKLRTLHGGLMFHQSGGCCDGSSPMCFAINDFKIGSSDLLLGQIYGCNFYISKEQFEIWKNTHLTVDITEGRGSSFSLEIPLGVRFVIKSRLFTKDELENLKPIDFN